MYNRGKLLKLQNLLVTLQNEELGMSLVQFAALLTIAREEGQGITEVKDRLGLPKATGTRTITALTERAGPGKEGYGLVDVRFDPMDARRKGLYLNEAGKEFVAKYVNMI